MSFSEASDENNYVQLESTSSVADVANGKEITWHFRVNPTGMTRKQSECTLD